jgi:hypothetical protein
MKSTGAAQDEILTYAEVERRFPGEWVLLEVVRSHGDAQKATGRLLAHSPDRDDLRGPHARARSERPNAVLSEWFNGERIPEGVVVVL